MGVIEDILQHAEKEWPNEACGVIIVYKGREIYHPCRNIAERMFNEFVIHPEDYLNAGSRGEVIKIVHSHPRSNADPSQADLVGVESSGVPWIIVNPKTGQVTETKPSGYRAPLIGRVYSYGTLDCFSIVRDYYKDVLNIEMPDKDREGYWWEHGKKLFLESFESYGFRRVDDLKLHDVILMFNSADTPNHFGIYLGDGKMLHHAQGRLSSRDVYGNAGYWYKNTWGYIRHLDLM